MIALVCSSTNAPKSIKSMKMRILILSHNGKHYMPYIEIHMSQLTKHGKLAILWEVWTYCKPTIVLQDLHMHTHTKADDEKITVAPEGLPTDSQL
jgi:hypothetical protein